MKKYARVCSMLALILTITFIFSGCGVIDFAKSILIKEEPTTTPTTTVSGDIVYTDEYTNSFVVTPPSDSVSDTQATSSTTSASVSSSSTTSTTVAESEASTATSTTQDNNKKPSTTAPVEEVVDKQEINDIKDIQDLLFASKDAEKTAAILNACGFEYDEEQGIYYSSVNPWQKNFGFNVIYDMTAPLAGMYYSTERIYFRYDNKDWMVQLWKGQYGITCGAEIGIYNKTDKIMQYDCVTEEEFVTMGFKLYNQNQLLFERKPEAHWWMTGFKIMNIGVPILLDMDVTITLKDKAMADAFEQGLKNANRDNLLDPMTYTRKAKTFNIHW